MHKLRSTVLRSVRQIRVSPGSTGKMASLVAWNDWCSPGTLRSHFVGSAHAMVKHHARNAKKTIAVFCDGGFLAHVTRSFEVGRALRHCFGHRVVFCCDGPYTHIPRDAGFEVVPVFTVDRDITMDVARKGTPPSLSWWKSVCDQSV